MLPGPCAVRRAPAIISASFVSWSLVMRTAGALAWAGAGAAGLEAGPAGLGAGFIGKGLGMYGTEWKFGGWAMGWGYARPVAGWGGAVVREVEKGTRWAL